MLVLADELGLVAEDVCRSPGWGKNGLAYQLIP
jgi:hypothetical protein